MPRVTLTANQVITVPTSAQVFNVAVLSGSILYKLGSAVVDANDPDAFALNEDVRTDSFNTGNSTAKTFHIRAGTSGAVIQYRAE
jgi:hypothetical protein